MQVDISPVTTPGDLNAFIKLPWATYKGDPNWVPPLLDNQRPLLDQTSGHPFHQHATVQLFLARLDGKPVGRIAAIENGQHNRHHADRAGFFGFFECIDDPEAANALVDAAAGWLEKRDLTSIRGPVSPSTNHEAGLLIEGFNTPAVFLMSYNPPYYPALMDACGLTKAMDLNAYHVDRSNPEPPARFEKVKRLVERVKRRANQPVIAPPATAPPVIAPPVIARSGGGGEHTGATWQSGVGPTIAIRKPDMRRFDQEAAAIKEIYGRAWSRNWGFVPWTDAEFDHQAVELKQLIVPELSRIITVDGRPAAFGIMLPDYNEAVRYINGRFWPFGLPFILAYYKLRRIKRLRLFALGVVEEHRRAGLEALLMHDLYLEILKSHYQRCELSWTLEENHLVNNAIEAWGCKVYKKYRIYEKTL